MKTRTVTKTATYQTKFRTFHICGKRHQPKKLRISTKNLLNAFFARYIFLFYWGLQNFYFRLSLSCFYHIYSFAFFFVVIFWLVIGRWCKCLLLWSFLFILFFISTETCKRFTFFYQFNGVVQFNKLICLAVIC